MRPPTALAAALAVSLAPAGTDDLESRLGAALEELGGEMVAIRRDLHRHPEPSGGEVRTAGVVAERLRSLGLEVRTGIGGHGVLGVLTGGRPGRVVAYRADMDAVPAPPLPESIAGLEPRSSVPGLRHACGHDLHVAIALGVAGGLTSIRDELPGSVLFVFQPAEETLEGARAMLAQGVFDGLEPDEIYALHTAPYPVGTMGGGPGRGLAGRDPFRLELPDSLADPGASVSAVEALRELGTVHPPDDPSGLSRVFETLGQADVGDWVFVNAWTGGGELRGVLQVGRAERRAEEMQRLQVTLEELGFAPEEVAEAFEAGVPQTASDPELWRAAAAVLRRALGEERVVEMASDPPFFSEDFGLFLERAPGAFLLLGVADPERGWNGMPHSPDFFPDERALGVGARAMSLLLLERLRAPTGEDLPRSGKAPRER